MPKRSSGSKSKRLSLRQKYKIIKKVKEHHKKKRKEEKKKGSNSKRPFGKDPGLPSQWPFKEELVKEFAFKRQQILAEEQRKKDERKRLRQEASAMQTDDADLLRLAALQASASHKLDDFEMRKKARLTSDTPGDQDSSRRAFYKEFRKVAEAADVVVQVLDARDPLACRCPDVERYIRSLNPNKKIILLLNKMDLVPREIGERWLKYFRQELPTVAFKCSTQQQAAQLGHKRMPSAKSADEGMHGAGCLGAETLLQLLKNYTRNMNIKTAITVGVVGLPNVGKSSLINSLKRSRVTQVGNTPGVTRAVQEVVLDKHIKLLDSPGIVFASAEDAAAAALRNCIKVERLPDPVLPVGEILRRVPAEQLMTLYKIGKFGGSDEFLQAVAAARGKLRKGGIPNVVAAAKIVLQDWNDGRIPYYTLPPSRGNEELADAQIVSSYAKDFDAEEVFANEASAVIAHLPSLEDAAGQRFFEAASAGGAKVDMEAMQAEEKASDGDDEDAMEDDEDEGAATAPSTTGSGRVRGSSAAQAEVLYGEEGQYNPLEARANKKRLKKMKKSAPAGDDSDSDFNFDEDNTGMGAESDGGDILAGSDDDAAAVSEGEGDSDPDSGEADSGVEEDDADVDGMEGSDIGASD